MSMAHSSKILFAARLSLVSNSNDISLTTLGSHSQNFREYVNFDSKFLRSKMTNPYGVSSAEFNLIKQQAARRATLRSEFIKQKTNPFKHASEAGYVFDPAIQKFLSMKTTQLDYFTATRSTSLFGVCAIIVPMFAYGYLLWKHRTLRENQIRSGELRYRERQFKFA